MYHPREMWSIMDLDDSLSLSMYELEKGISTITRSEEWFDCYPAVQTAFKFTKRLHMVDDAEVEDDDDSAEEKTETVLFYSEFAEFLSALVQYYSYCKVFGNTEVEEGVMVDRDSFCNPEVQAEIRIYVGDVSDATEEYDAIDKDGVGEVRFDCIVNWAFKRSLGKRMMKEEE